MKFTHLYVFMASAFFFSIKCWNGDWNEGKLGNENGKFTVGLQLAVLNSANSPLNKINMNFLRRFFTDLDDILAKFTLIISF